MAAVALAAGLCCAAAAQTSRELREPIEPIPLRVEFDAGRAALGELLFQDKRLSLERDRSCASCHPLDRGGVDGRMRAEPRNNLRRMRNTPTVFNVVFNGYVTWDGAFDGLGPLTEKVLTDPALMANTWPEILTRIRADPELARRFGENYRLGATRENVLDAFEQFLRSLTTPNSRFDRWLRGQTDAISEDELRGYGLFKNFGCVSCHQGVNVGGNLFQKFGVFWNPERTEEQKLLVDWGKFRWSRDERDREVFRVPPLRNVELTAPYFHDGKAPRLETAVRAMAQVQLDRRTTPEEERLLVAFLRTLTGEYKGQPLAPPAAPER